MGVAKDTTGLPGLAARRKAASLTQDLLAQRAGLHRVTIACYESGSQDPGLAVIRRLANVLGCAVADLVTPPQEAQASANPTQASSTEA